MTPSGILPLQLLDLKYFLPLQLLRNERSKTAYSTRGIDEAREQGTLFRHVSLPPHHLFFVTNQSRSVFRGVQNLVSIHMVFPPDVSIKT